MVRLIVVERPERWPFQIPDVEVVSARDYLTAPRFADIPRATVLNFCRSYAKNTTGYYVSLLAAARGHRPLPSVTTLQSLLVDSVVRVASEELDDLVQSSLKPLRSDSFELSVYFGRNVAERYAKLSRALYGHFPVPYLRARFRKDPEGSWELVGVRAVSASEVPEDHRAFVIEATTRFFQRGVDERRKRKDWRYDLAILWSEDDPQAPSDAGAIRKLIRAAERVGIKADIIGPDDFGRLEIYDALFIRETTHVGHHTHRFALRAQAAGLVVVDDPESIVRCTNKVYQAELFRRHGIAAPETLVVHEGNRASVAQEIGLPCVLKDPTGAFSSGVTKAETQEELDAALQRLLDDSELVIAQEWTPSAFDWRIGVLERRPLFAARYHMARGHWQIVRQGAPERSRYGKVEAVPVEEVPRKVLDLALAAARLIGDGLYGVDLKELDDGRVVVTEVNDNPNLDSGEEDRIVGDALYDAVMGYFARRLEARGARR
ncbi:MAG: RimK family protein [Longimicrobiales bacterium]|nr:RimK family protein [Longimicrobiales bacterium]